MNSVQLVNVTRRAIIKEMEGENGKGGYNNNNDNDINKKRTRECSRWWWKRTK